MFPVINFDELYRMGQKDPIVKKNLDRLLEQEKELIKNKCNQKKYFLKIAENKSNTMIFEKILKCLYSKNTLYLNNLIKKFTLFHPFCCEGIILKSIDHPNKIDIYSSRLGKTTVDDFPERNGSNFVTFTVEKPDVYSNFIFAAIPVHLKSQKCMKNGDLELRGIGVLKKDNNLNEKNWEIWNETLGRMRVLSGSAEKHFKNLNNWPSELSMVSFTSCFYNNRFIVKKISYLNIDDKILMENKEIPNNIFLIKECRVILENFPRCQFISKTGFKVIGNLTSKINLETDYWVAAVPTISASKNSVLLEAFFFASEEKWKTDSSLKVLIEKFEENFRDFSNRTDST